VQFGGGEVVEHVVVGHGPDTAQRRWVDAALRCDVISR
jgi:hypothetical protein